MPKTVELAKLAKLEKYAEYAKLAKLATTESAVGSNVGVMKKENVGMVEGCGVTRPGWSGRCVASSVLHVPCCVLGGRGAARGIRLRSEASVEQADAPYFWGSVYESYDNYSLRDKKSGARVVGRGATDGRRGASVLIVGRADWTEFDQMDLIAPADSAFAGPWLRPHSFRRFPGGSSRVLFLVFLKMTAYGRDTDGHIMNTSGREWTKDGFSSFSKFSIFSRTRAFLQITHFKMREAQAWGEDPILRVLPSVIVSKNQTHEKHFCNAGR